MAFWPDLPPRLGCRLGKLILAFLIGPTLIHSAKSFSLILYIYIYFFFLARRGILFKYVLIMWAKYLFWNEEDFNLDSFCPFNIDSVRSSHTFSSNRLSNLNFFFFLLVRTWPFR